MRGLNMAEEEKNNNRTYILVVVVMSFFAIGLVTILKSRETEHLNYMDNTSVEQEAQLYEGAKRFNNVFEDEG